MQKNQTAIVRTKEIFYDPVKMARGDTIKLGRLKFNVKDYRTQNQPANLDLKKQGVIDRSASPVKQRYKVDDGDDSEDAAKRSGAPSSVSPVNPGADH